MNVNLVPPSSPAGAIMLLQLGKVFCILLTFSFQSICFLYIRQTLFQHHLSLSKESYLRFYIFNLQNDGFLIFYCLFLLLIPLYLECELVFLKCRL